MLERENKDVRRKEKKKEKTKRKTEVESFSHA
jgi:hypothetical protein